MKKKFLENYLNMPQNVADGEERTVKRHADPTSKQWEPKTEHSRDPTEYERCPRHKACACSGDKDPDPTAPKH